MILSSRHSPGSTLSLSPSSTIKSPDHPVIRANEGSSLERYFIMVKGNPVNQRASQQKSPVQSLCSLTA